MKRVLLLIVLFAVVIFSAGCKEKEEAGVLFNTEPINEKNFMQCGRNFEAGTRIYYLFYTPEELQTEFIRVQVFKAADNTHVGGYSVLFAKDYRVMKNNHYYFSNHIVIHNPGKYVLQVFDVNDIRKPIAWNYFFVR